MARANRTNLTNRETLSHDDKIHGTEINVEKFPFRLMMDETKTMGAQLNRSRTSLEHDQ